MLNIKFKFNKRIKFFHEILLRNKRLYQKRIKRE